MIKMTIIRREGLKDMNIEIEVIKIVNIFQYA